nr:AEC family transporter [Sedimentibacter sp.]
MENLIFSINVVLPMFLIMCLGVFLRKINIFDEKFLKTANAFTFKVLLPTLLFYNIYSSNLSDSFNWKLVTFAVITVLITIALLFIIVPLIEKDNKNKGVIIQGLYRSNFVLFGIPLCTNIFGDESTGVTSMLIAVIVPLYNFFAVIILDVYSKDKLDIKNTFLSILKNPLIVGSVAGILLSLLNVKIPGSLEQTIYDISKIATPLALILLGGEFEIGNLYKNIKHVLIVCIGKLILIPTIVFAIAIAVGFRGIELGSLLAMVAAPVAVSSFIMAQHYNANDELAGQIVFVSTTFSSITIFMFIYIFKTIGLF